MPDLNTFDAVGFCVLAGVVPPADCDRLCSTLSAEVPDTVGSRTLLAHPACRELVATISNHSEVRPLLPPSLVAVQCTLFDKTPDKNWLVSLHQDLSIPVRARVESDQFGAWSRKEGQWFVQPPEEVLNRLVAVRVHLDASTAENGPLRVVPGSHRFGRLTAPEADTHRKALGEIAVESPRGGALVMRPLLLHASSKATSPIHRRVLHFVFGPADLPHGLEWAETA
jgi:phytanoyl-CoA dioxygenase PhyH